MKKLTLVRMRNKLAKHYAYNASMYGKESALAKTAYNTYRLFCEKHKIPLYENPFVTVV